MTALAVTKGSDNTAKGCPQKCPVIGHYTQVVWAETAEVGCGFIVTEERKQRKDGSFYIYKRNVRIVFISH